MIIQKYLDGGWKGYGSKGTALPTQYWNEPVVFGELLRLNNTYNPKGRNKTKRKYN